MLDERHESVIFWHAKWSIFAIHIWIKFNFTFASNKRAFWRADTPWAGVDVRKQQWIGANVSERNIEIEHILQTTLLRWFGCYYVGNFRFSHQTDWIFAALSFHILIPSILHEENCSPKMLLFRYLHTIVKFSWQEKRNASNKRSCYASWRLLFDDPKVKHRKLQDLSLQSLDCRLSMQ